MSAFYEAKITYMDLNPDTGNERKASGELIIERDMSTTKNYASLEQKIIDWALINLPNYSDYGILINHIKESKIGEVFAYDDGEYWYRCKVVLTVVDEEAGREKRQTNYHALKADSTSEANARLIDSLNYLVIPYKSIEVKESRIIDVVPHFSTVDTIIQEVKQVPEMEQN